MTRDDVRQALTMAQSAQVYLNHLAEHWAGDASREAREEAANLGPALKILNELQTLLPDESATPAMRTAGPREAT